MNPKARHIKITLIAFLLALSAQVNADTIKNNSFKRHEAKVNISQLLFTSIVVEYEYLLNSWSSVGMVAAYRLEFPSDLIFPYALLRIAFGSPTKVLGNYRLYLSRLHAQGFFLEGHLGIISKYEDLWPVRRVLSASSGFALGWKWYYPEFGISVDFVLGGGWLLGTEDSDGYLRWGLTLGKRF
jgi:hypothetical protein